jgi:hypothetical protein
MSLSIADVRAVLEAAQLPTNFTAHGFVLRSSYPMARIERGSGIAGRGDCWRIVEQGKNDNGWVSTASVSSRKELRRLLREFCAGDKPIDQPGYAWHARLNRNRFGDAYIWVARKTSAALSSAKGTQG